MTDDLTDETTNRPELESELRSAARQKTTASRGESSRRRWRKAGYTFGAMGCFFAIAVGAVFGHFYWGSSAFRDLWNNHGGDMIRGVLTGEGMLNAWTPEKQFTNRTTLNVLVLGIDHDYNNKAQIIRNTWGRSDAILLARVDFAKKTISALTIPRDSAVRIPGYRGVHKINAAHSYRGPALTIETIKSVFGVQADAAVSVNFEGFQKLVDAIGGVEINVTKQLDYDDNWGNLHVHLKPGLQHLTGYEAMGYVRIRKQDSDFHRSQRQHEFLEALRNKIKSPSTFLALPKAIDTLSDNVNVVNLSRDQMYTLMNFARTLPRENIRIETLPSIEGPRFVTIDTEKSEEVIQRLFFPNQLVALNIEAPNMSGRRTSSTRRQRSSRARRTEYIRPSGGLSVETPASSSEGTSPAPETGATSTEESAGGRDDTSSSTSEPSTERATG